MTLDERSSRSACFSPMALLLALCGGKVAHDIATTIGRPCGTETNGSQVRHGGGPIVALYGV